MYISYMYDTFAAHVLHHPQCFEVGATCTKILQHWNKYI